MKTIQNQFLFLLISVLTLSSCGSVKTSAGGKKVDQNLVGIWQGSENDKQTAGMKKEWIMNRSADGTFTLQFKTIYDGSTDEFTEKGRWWTKGNKFYEYHDNSGKTDTYTYLVLNENQVQFEMLDTEVDFENKNYTFIDTRVSEINSDKTTNDGLSFENAIKVNSIAEEYDYVRRNCSKCKFLGQSLVEKKGKPYDVLMLKKENGEEVSYYFDISSFYGKR
jgi:hypothetical protein